MSVARSSSLPTGDASRSRVLARSRCLGGGLLCFPLPLHGPAVDAQRAGEGLDGGEQPLLQPDDQETGGGLLAFRGVLEPLLAEGAVLVEQRGQREFRGVLRQAVDVDLDNVRLGKPPWMIAEVLLEPPDHDLVAVLRGDGHAAAEPLRIEDLEQRREAVGVAVVRRGRQEQPVLEPRGQVAHGPGDLRVDGVPLAARRGGVMGLVEDQQRAAAEGPQPVAERPGVGLVDQQAMRDQEAGMRAPRIDAEAALAPDPLHVLLVEDRKRQAEAGVEFVLPLQEHRRRAGRRRSPAPSCAAAARGR